MTADEVRLSAPEAEFLFSRPSARVLLVRISGHDVGQFGSVALDEIAAAISRSRPIEVFVDARDATGVSPRVREEWTQFISANRTNLTAVHVLTSSRIVHLAIAVAQLFSRTGNLIRLYSTPAVFQAELQRAIAR